MGRRQPGSARSSRRGGSGCWWIKLMSRRSSPGSSRTIPPPPKRPRMQTKSFGKSLSNLGEITETNQKIYKNAFLLANYFAKSNIFCTFAAK